MVQIFRTLFKDAVKKVRRHMRGGNVFLDTLRLSVHGGHGGNGLPKYGGVGGQGGCVFLVAQEGVTLRQLTGRFRDKRIWASCGENSSKFRILGRRGMDVRVEVPIGVQIYDDHGKMLGDLNEVNAQCIVAGGGMGGCTGTNFLGKPGDQRMINLDLKLIADVGLVGFPNAGKSTFLKAISRAKPKIASYPFTTIRPQIGTVEFKDLRQITIADLPGLIEGAHANFGMGHKFLKHIERTRLLLFVVDIFGFQLSAQRIKRSSLETVYALNKELELYDETLLEKPSILLVNKMDVPESKELWTTYQNMMEHLAEHIEQCPEEIRPQKLLKFEKIIPISAKDSQNIEYVQHTLREVLDEWAAVKHLPSEDEIKKRLQEQVTEKANIRTM